MNTIEFTIHEDPNNIRKLEIDIPFDFNNILKCETDIALYINNKFPELRIKKQRIKRLKITDDNDTIYETNDFDYYLSLEKTK